LNLDGDPFGDACDCAPGDGTVWGAPFALSGVLVFRNNVPGDLTVSWTSEDAIVGPGTNYDVARGRLNLLHTGGYPGGAVCAANDLPNTPYLEPAPLCPNVPDNGCWYLGRAQNGC